MSTITSKFSGFVLEEVRVRFRSNYTYPQRELSDYLYSPSACLRPRTPRIAHLRGSVIDNKSLIALDRSSTFSISNEQLPRSLGYVIGERILIAFNRSSSFLLLALYQQLLSLSCVPNIIINQQIPIAIIPLFSRASFLSQLTPLSCVVV